MKDPVGNEFFSNVIDNGGCPNYLVDDKLNLDAVRNNRRRNLNPILVNPSFNLGAFAHFGGSRDATETSRIRPFKKIVKNRHASLHSNVSTTLARG